MTQENDIRLAYISTLLDGGYTAIANAEPIINPKSGYVVGGAWKESTMPTLRARTNPISHYAQFKELWLECADHVERIWGKGMGVGTWIHKGKIYFDVVELFDDIKGASFHAKQRGEIAIYDCTNQKEILI